MLYRFKSKVTGDLILLEPSGRRLLAVIGKDPAPKGIIEPAQMGAAIAALQAAVAREEQQRLQAEAEAREQGVAPVPAPEVGLRQRAAPFIDMLRRCEQANEPVVWGV